MQIATLPYVKPHSACVSPNRYVLLMLMNDCVVWHVQDLLRTTLILIDSRSDCAIKTLGVTLLIILATATENINQNALMEYMLQVDLLPTILRVCHLFEPEPESERERTFSRSNMLGNDQILAQVNPSTHITLAYNAAVLLALLLNYQKYERRDTLVQQFSQVSEVCAQTERERERFLHVQGHSS
jgi:hypothetical protein